jgi:hypothetical protein
VTALEQHLEDDHARSVAAAAADAAALRQVNKWRLSTMAVVVADTVEQQRGHVNAMPSTHASAVLCMACVHRPQKRPSLSQERAEVQRLQQAVTARDLAVAAAESAAEDERRAAALREARLAAVQAALQQREAEFQALRTSLRWQKPASLLC